MLAFTLSTQREKTKWALEQAIKYEAILVSDNLSDLEDLIQECGKPIKIISYEDFAAGVLINNGYPVVLDDVICFLNHFTAGKIIAY